MLSRALFGGSPAGAEGHTLRLVLSLAVELVEADEGSILVLDDATCELVFAMTSADPSLIGQRVPVGEGPTGLAVATRSVQAGAPLSPHHSARSPAAELAAPLVVGDRVVGVLTAVSFAGGKTFGARDIRAYGKLAALAATVVDQQQRLGVIEGEIGDGPMDRITGSLARIGAVDTDSREQVANLLETIEHLVSR